MIRRAPLLLALALLAALLTLGGGAARAEGGAPSLEEMGQALDSGEIPLAWAERGRALLAEDPDSVPGHVLMGLTLHRLEGDLPRARFHLARARALATGSSQGGAPYLGLILYELRGVLAEMDLYEEQLEALDAFSAAMGDDFISADYAWPLMKLGREVEAREKLSRAFRSAHPFTQLVAWNTLGALEMEVGNVSASYQAFQRLMEEARRNGWEMDCTFYRNAGEAALTMGRYDEAERLFQTATRDFDTQTFSNPYWDLSGLYLGQGRFPEAIETTRRMHQWSRAVKPFLYQQTMADNQQRTGELLSELGYGAEALRQLEQLVQRPDRRGGTSGKKDQSEAGNLTVWRTALLDERARLGEEMASARGLEWWRLAWRRLVLSARAAAAGRRVAALAVANDRIEGSLRPYWAGSILMGEWYRPALVELYGPGVTAGALASLRERRPEKLDLEEPFLKTIDGEIARLRGRRQEAVEHLQAALDTLPQAEVLLRARTQARAAQLLLDLGDASGALIGFQKVLEAAPGMLRRVGASLPIRIEGGGNATLEEVARMLERSPRFHQGEPGLPVSLGLAGDELQASLGGVDGSVLATARVALEGSPEATARALARAFHAQVFSPKIDLSQAELNSLDGSNFSGSSSSQPFRELFGLPEEPKADL